MITRKPSVPGRNRWSGTGQVCYKTRAAGAGGVTRALQARPFGAIVGSDPRTLFQPDISFRYGRGEETGGWRGARPDESSDRRIE